MKLQFLVCKKMIFLILTLIFIQCLPASMMSQDQRMTPGDSMVDYRLALKQRYPQFPNEQLDEYINKVLDAKSNPRASFFFKTPVMSPQQLVAYKPNNTNDPLLEPTENPVAF